MLHDHSYACFILKKGASVAGKCFAVSGRAGCGKSSFLHYAAQFAAKQNWFVDYMQAKILSDLRFSFLFHIRLVITVTGREFPLDTLGLIRPSKSRPGIYEQVSQRPSHILCVLTIVSLLYCVLVKPPMTQLFLKNLAKSQKAQLSNVRSTQIVCEPSSRHACRLVRRLFSSKSTSTTGARCQLVTKHLNKRPCLIWSEPIVRFHILVATLKALFVYYA